MRAGGSLRRTRQRCVSRSQVTMEAAPLCPVAVVPPEGCDEWDYFHEQVRQPDGSLVLVGRWAGMIATAESHPELPPYSPTSPNQRSHTSSIAGRTPAARVRGRPLAILAAHSSPSTPPSLRHLRLRLRDRFGMLVDSDGDCAHEFLVENVLTGELVQRVAYSPTRTLSGSSISSGDLYGSYATPRGLGEVGTCSVHDAPSRPADLERTVSATGSSSSVPTLQQSPRRRPRPSSLLAMRVRRSPLPMPPPRRGVDTDCPRIGFDSPRRSRSCVSVSCQGSSDQEWIMEL